MFVEHAEFGMEQGKSTLISGKGSMRFRPTGLVDRSFSDSERAYPTEAILDTTAEA